MKKTKQLVRFPLLLTCVVGIVIAGAIFLKTYSAYKEIMFKSNVNTRKYTSSLLDFSIEVPISWQTKEDITFVDLISESGKINISRNGTNFSDLENYIKDFDGKRRLFVSKENKSTINGYNSLMRIEEFLVGPIKKQKVYFIYVSGWVYSLSTSSESLFDNLDQIAQSFRYLPK